MAAPTMYPGLTFPAYYDLDGNPAVIPDGLTLPSVLKNGRWETDYDPPTFRREAERVTKEQFETLVRESGG